MIYNRNKQVELMRDAITDGFATHDGELIEFWDGLLDQHATNFKDVAFSEESEWRMTSIFVDPTGAPSDDYIEFPVPKYRATRYGIAPYVEIEVPTNAIIEIVIGPKSPMRERHWVLRQFLRQHEIATSVQFVNSLATYR